MQPHREQQPTLGATTASTTLLQRLRAEFSSLPPRTRLSVQLAFAAMLLLLLILLGYFLARDTSLARLQQLRGGAERDFASSMGAWEASSVGARFHDGDGARTAEGQEAEFLLFSGAHLHLKSSSQIRFMRRGDGDALGLQVNVGEVDLITEEGLLTLDSQFGEIVIEPNSSITMRREGVKLSLDVALGSIELTGQTFQAGTHIDVELGGIILDSRPIGKSETPEEAVPEEEAPEEEQYPIDLGDGVTFAHVVAQPGTNFVVHDAKTPSAVGFSPPEDCEHGLEIRIGKLKTQGRKQAALMLRTGRHAYEIRCLEDVETVVATGSIGVLRDAGTRPLPTFHPTASVATDGRRYTVLFQQKLPQVTVSWPSAPKASSYTLTIDGVPRKTKSASVSLGPGTLRSGSHTLVFSAKSDPPRKSRTTTVVVQYDSQAPQARVSEPRSGSFAAGESVNIAGQALPGWSVSLDGEPVALDARGRFSAQHKVNGALPVAFSHPKHGLHYYVRRPAQ